MTQYQSDKLKVISFASILLVLYIHSGFHDYPNEIQGMVFNHYLQESISGGLGQCAVPMFFAISGFLFFRGINSLHDVYAKMKKRVRTILIPFIIAAWFLPLFYIAIESIPAASRYINAGGITDVFKNESVWYIFQALYIHVPGEPNPWGFHLWFMQDLIGIILLSPLLFYARKALGDYKFIGGGYFINIESLRNSILTYSKRLLVHVGRFVSRCKQRRVAQMVATSIKTKNHSASVCCACGCSDVRQS